MRHRTIALGALVGYGAWVSVRLIVERCVVGVVVPMVWLLPFAGLGLGMLRGRPSWRDQPAILAAIAVVLMASVADLAHVFYVPIVAGAVARQGALAHRHSAELVAVVSLLPIVFQRLGRCIGDICGHDVHRGGTAGEIALGMALGSAAGLATVELGGAYAAQILFVVAVALTSTTRWCAACVVAVALAAVMWIETKAERFFPVTSPMLWTERAWSAEQKLDRVSGEGCEAWVLNNVTMRHDCSARREPGSSPDPLPAALARELRVVEAVHLGFGPPRPLVPMLDALPDAAHVTFVTPERPMGAWLAGRIERLRSEGSSDREVTVVVAEPRSFAGYAEGSADLVFVDGVDLPFVAGLFLPVPAAAWLFTREGFASLTHDLSPDGVLLIERLAAKPEDLSRMLAAVPDDLEVAWAECPAASRPLAELPCAWIGLARSDAAGAAIERAFRGIPGARSLQVPERPRGKPPTDDRPFGLLAESFFLAESVLGVAILAAVVAPTRHRWTGLPRGAGRRAALAGSSVALAQAAIVSSLGRVVGAFGESAVLVLALTWVGVALGSYARRRGRFGLDELVRRPFRLASVAAGCALAVATIATSVTSPYANRALAVPLALVGGCLPGFGWAVSVSGDSAPDVRRRWAAGWFGYAFGLMIAPALLAVHGFELVVLVSALSASIGWRARVGDDRSSGIVTLAQAREEGT